RDEAIRQILDEYGHLPEVRRLVEFIRISERGVVGRDR
ncbi:MAG: acyl-[acyl-carrier-protein]--UDP-N-acetylglucosamine O-acyltransferase, partial [Deltaproteobacteria bacterium]|nr:acyl-[acyl-carrier-protein]--UDP-N-acetylglucosamine O-acyltransferase [Deltaproteobacteria bacterium]